MKIIVDGSEAFIKSGSTFEFVSENRLFLGRDSYTLSITFPLNDCPANTAIFGYLHRIDVDIDTVKFDCTIIDGLMVLVGSLIVASLSEDAVQCQFVEGRCGNSVDNKLADIKLSDLNLGYVDTILSSDISPLDAWNPDRGAVALPWINNDYPDVPNNWVVLENGRYSWDSGVSELSWQPYLLELVKRILKAVDYTCNLTAWEQSPLRYLLVCNTLPSVWDKRDFAYALPDWSVSEFFENLELWLGAEFNFDHKTKNVEFAFIRSLLETLPVVKLTEIVDSFSGTVTHEQDSSNCEYLGVKRITYADNHNPLWNYLSCDWYFKKFPNYKIIEYETIHDLIEKNKRKDSYDDEGNLKVLYGETVFVGYDGPTRPGMQSGYDTTVGRVLYAKDIDTYFVFRAIGTIKSKIFIGKDVFGKKQYRDIYWYEYMLQPINIFGTGSPESDEVETEELYFVPAWIQSTYISSSDDRGPMLFMAPGELSDSSSSSDDGSIRQPGAAHYIDLGDNGDEYKSNYDVVYLGYWDGINRSGGITPCPQIDRFNLYDDWSFTKGADFDLRLLGTTTANVQQCIPSINPNTKYIFSWLGAEIPNPRSIFHIRGKLFVCEKITATFTENGMSQLLKGEFYPLIDD